MPTHSTSTKTALVTAASRGLGRAIAERLAADGFSVIVNFAGNADAAQEAVTAISKAGGNAIAVQADVSKSSEVVSLFDTAEKTFGKVDVLVNNAGRAIRKPLAEFSDEEFETVFSTNIAGAFYTLREAARRLRDGGRIVNISASFQGAPIPGYSVYAASKMAIEQMTAVAAKELGARQICVNAIRPGPSNTDLFRTGKSAEVIQHFASLAALGRITEPSDVANVVSFLVGPQGGWVTGQAFGVNGGYW